MPRKWEQGHMIWTYRDFEVCVRNRSVLYVSGFFKGHPTSAVMVGNMSYTLVTRLITNGRINLAVQREEYRDWLREELLGPEPVPSLYLPREVAP